jgi:hypothetical protein
MLQLQLLIQPYALQSPPVLVLMVRLRYTADNIRCGLEVNKNTAFRLIIWLFIDSAQGLVIVKSRAPTVASVHGAGHRSNRNDGFAWLRFGREYDRKNHSIAIVQCHAQRCAELCWKRNPLPLPFRDIRS